MTTINLKDFYSWYTHDEYIEVPDEVAEELKADKRYEAAYRRRVTRNKAQYSLDCDDGIEYSACLHEPSPEELVLRAERFFYLWNALNTLPEMRAAVWRPASLMTRAMPRWAGPRAYIAARCAAPSCAALRV